MNVEIGPELKEHHSLPAEHELWLSVIRYGGMSTWIGGPFGKTKEEVTGIVASYGGVADVRLYKVMLPTVKV